MNAMAKIVVAGAAIGGAAATAFLGNEEPEKSYEMTKELEVKCDQSSKNLKEWKEEYEKEHGRIGLIGYDWKTGERIWKRSKDGRTIRVTARHGYYVRETDERY